MQAAREAEETTQIGSQRASGRRRLPLLTAAFIVPLCAAAAFLVLVLHDHGHARLMVHDQAALPATAGGQKTVARSIPVVPAAKPDQPVTPASAAASFRLEARKATALGPIRVRLTRTDERKGLYDISVLSGRRSFSHRHLRLNTPVWISLGRNKGAMQILVTSIANKAVEGNWLVSDRSPELTATHSNKH